MRNFLKMIAWSTAAIILALTVSACGVRDAGVQGNPPIDVPASGSPSEHAAEQEETKFLFGKFNGLADGHTMEIETDKGPQAYQISRDIAQKAETWEPGAKVKYKAKGLTITEIHLE